VKILGFPFPLPPLAEQRRIEAKVNELMASCDRLEEQQKERNIRHTAIARASLARFADAPTPANLEFLFHDSYTLEPADLRKTILAIATHGRLVPHDPDDEPADILLQRIQEWRAGLQQWYQLPTESEPLRVEGDIGNSLPRSWRYVRIGEICLSIVPQRDRPLSFSGKIPWVTLPCFRENSLTLNYNEMGLSPDEVARYRLRIVPAGSVLMSCVGRFGLVALPDRDVVPNQQIHGFYFSPELMDGRFLCYTIMAQKDYLEAQSNTTTISYLNKSKCESVPVFLPPIAEQRRIAAKIDHLMVLVDRLETQLAAYQFSAARLMEAFVSELVSVKD
jgi:type I restriction enzyme S subunit